MSKSTQQTPLVNEKFGSVGGQAQRLFIRLAGAPIIPVSTLSGVGLPMGVAWANWFAFFNGLSWAVVLGAPLFLFAKSLGAGDGVLGFIAALPPLLNVLHIPGNHLIPKLGYRRMLLLGWTSRTVAILFMSFIPLLVPEHAIALALLITLLIIFSSCRGLTGGAWMPWVSTLVPNDVRGKFFLRDQLFGQTGNILALAVITVIFHSISGAVAFFTAFAVATVGGTISVLCMTAVPDVTNADLHVQAGSRIPFIKMLSDSPFRLLCLFNVAYMLVMGSLAVFTVAYLRDVARLPSADIIGLSVFSTLGGVASLFWCGKVIGKTGAKPIIIGSLIALFAVFLCWFLLAAGVVPPRLPILGIIYVLSGIAGINFSAANNHLQSVLVPHIGRNHYFALLLVLLNLAAGASPMLWGLVLEAIGNNHAVFMGLHFNRYTILFGACAVMLIPVLAMLRRLHEHQPDRGR
jgi:MFS family permease